MADQIILTRALTLLLSIHHFGIVYPGETCYDKGEFTSQKRYNGTINRTLYGTLCQRWDSNTPHAHNRNQDSMFLDDASVSDASNYCRDTTGLGDITCFTTNPAVVSERCSIPDCSDPEGYHLMHIESDFLRCRYVPESGECDFNEEFFCRGSITYTAVRSQLARERCKDLLCCERRGCRNGEAHEYDGQWSVTDNGYTCRPWGGYLQTPPEPDFFPEQSLANASNYCRDPDLSGYTWCYTDKRGFRGIFIRYPCEIPTCDEYVLPQIYDHTCYNITDQDVEMYSRGGSADVKTVCESVPGRVYLSENDNNYPGCTDCSCCLMKGCYTGNSRTYKGTWSVTANGLKCKSWTDTCLGEDDALFPDDTVADAHNYCRHTSVYDDRGLWCYTDDPNIPVDNCDIPQCDYITIEPPSTRVISKEQQQHTTTTTTVSSTITTSLSSFTDANSLTMNQTIETSRASKKTGSYVENLFLVFLAYTCMCVGF